MCDALQVQGKDREKVAAVADALQLSEFVPRSYIEQVQLSKLTQEFQAFTDDVRKRFSMSGNNALEALNDAYGSSPPPFGGYLGTGLGFGRGTANRSSRTGNGMGGMYSPGPNMIDDGLMSTSAPVHGTRPIPIQVNSNAVSGKLHKVLKLSIPLTVQVYVYHMIVERLLNTSCTYDNTITFSPASVRLCIPP